MGEDGKLKTELNDGLGLLKNMRDETGLLYDALTSIGTNIASAIEEAVDGATELNDIGKTIATTYGKEIEKSLKKSAKSLEGNIKLQIKINKGQNASKAIEDAITANLSRKEVTLMHINNLHANLEEITAEQLLIQEDLTAEAIRTFEANEKLLKKQKEENKEKQKGISIYKLMGNSLGGMVDKLDKSGTLSGILKGNMKEVVTIERLSQVAAMALVTSIIEGVIELDKLQTQYNKSFGLTDEQAMSVHHRMARIADTSARTSINFRDMHKAMSGIGDATGVLATGLRDDVIGEAAELHKLLGVSNKGMAMLAFNAQVTGQNMRAQSESMVGAITLTEQQLGLKLDERKIFQEVAELSGLIRANFGRNVVAMTETLAKAKAFGLTMQDLASISSNLLNFQSSIEAELTAELFTGKQLNLEKARLYALTGDYKGLMGEILNQMGSEHEFLTMNVLAKQKYAAALGMSVDQMSDLIFKEGDLAALKADATAAGDKDTLNMLKQRDLAEKMADIMAKLQTTFLSIAEGPIGTLGHALSGILDNTNLLYGVLGLMAAVKIAGLISGIASLGAVLGFSSIGALSLMSALTLGLGVAAIAGGIYYGASVMEKEKNKAAKPPKMGSFKNLPKGKINTVDEGEAIIHPREYVGHTSDVEVNNPVLQDIKQLLSFLLKKEPMKVISPTKYP